MEDSTSTRWRATVRTRSLMRRHGSASCAVMAVSRCTEQTGRSAAFSLAGMATPEQAVSTSSRLSFAGWRMYRRRGLRYL